MAICQVSRQNPIVWQANSIICTPDSKELGHQEVIVGAHDGEPSPTWLHAVPTVDEYISKRHPY